MAHFAVHNLRTVLERVPRGLDGVHMTYGHGRLTLASASDRDTVLAEEESAQPVIPGEDWELVAYSASLDTVRAWLRMQKDEEQFVGISPFWGGGDHRVVFTGCGTQLAFPVIELPSAPRH